MVVGIAAYANVLPAPFVFDDEPAIVVNESITHLSTSFAPQAAGSPLAGRPLVALTFALNYAAGGLNVRGYRLVNIALHVVCALLLFLCVGRALAARRPATAGSEQAPREAAPYTAFAVALLWMVHPLNTEAVDYVSQRTELMMAMFMLLTLYFGGSASPERALGGTRPTNPARLTRPTLSVICCGLGMTCKETMAVAPLLVVMYDRTFVFGSFGEAWRARWRYYGALAATWLVLAALLRSSPRGSSVGFTGASVTPWTYLLDQAVMIVRYLRLTFWPRDLVLDYGVPPQATFAQVAPYAIAVAALLAATIVAVACNTRIGFLGAWFFLTLAPTSSIIPISTEVGAERRMYLPLVAIIVLITFSVGRAFTARRPGAVASRTAPPKAAPYTAVIVAIALLLLSATIARNSEYLSPLTLWQGVIDRWPGNPRAERNLAAELKLAGRRDEEIVHLRNAADGIPEVRNVLGVELMSLNRNDEATAELQRYVRDYPRDADGWSNLGNALAAGGHGADATRAYQRAVDIDPDNGLSQRNLALQLFDANDFNGAVAHAREAVRLTPNDPDPHNLLGLALAGQGRLDDAIAEFRASLRIRPDNNDAAGYLERALKAR